MRRLLPLAVILTVLAVPAVVLASHQFADVPDSQPFHTEIGWMRDNNITQGSTECGSPPPEQTFYCPESNVRRDAMAAFLYRVANNQVVDAGKLEGQTLANLDGRYVNNGQANSVNSAMVMDDAIGASELADGAVGTAHLEPDAVTSGNIADGTVTSNDLANGSILFADWAANGCSSGQVPKWSGTAWTCADDTGGNGSSWSLAGNAGTTPGTHFLGTTDDKALEVRVNDQRALRVEPGTVPNLVGGWSDNVVTPGVIGAVIDGGGATGATNRVTDNHGTVGGGRNNQAGNADFDTANAASATVAGGTGNTASGSSATVGGGVINLASGSSATVGGGGGNTASGNAATVGGGQTNNAIASSATVGGGLNNLASGTSATVAGGANNTAHGDYSAAAGRFTSADDSGAFVWGDSQCCTHANSPGANTYSVRAQGGIWLGATNPPSTIPTGRFIDTSTGAHLTTGGAWTNTSDRAAKTRFQSVDQDAVLDALAGLPITSWSYRTEDPLVRHIGPTAQDFAAAFGLGESDRHISTVDADGVALAAIQALHAEVEALKAERDGNPVQWAGWAAAGLLAGTFLERKKKATTAA